MHVYSSGSRQGFVLATALAGTIGHIGIPSSDFRCAAVELGEPKSPAEWPKNPLPFKMAGLRTQA